MAKVVSVSDALPASCLHACLLLAEAVRRAAVFPMSGRGVSSLLQAYLWPIGQALLTFPVLALLFTLPFLIVQYRKHGYVHKLRGLVLYSLLLYLLTALYLVILPLPETRSNCPPGAGTSGYVQSVPLQFVRDFLKETQFKPGVPSTYWGVLKERAFLQAAFNVLLFVPFGLILRYYFRRKLWISVAWSLLLSLLFEVTQVTGIYGIFECPYRLFDVDDLLLNTSGGLLGWLVAPWLTGFLPRIHKLDDEVDLTTVRVSYIRRLIAWQLDAVLLFAAFALFGLFGKPVAAAAVVGVYFIVLPYVTGGLTLGKAAVRIRLQGRGERPTLRELAMRYVPLYGIIGGMNYMVLSRKLEMLPPYVLTGWIFVLVPVNAAFALHVLLRLFRRDKGLFYEEWSGTKHVVSASGLKPRETNRPKPR